MQTGRSLPVAGETARAMQVEPGKPGRQLVHSVLGTLALVALWSTAKLAFAGFTLPANRLIVEVCPPRQAPGHAMGPL